MKNEGMVMFVIGFKPWGLSQRCMHGPTNLIKFFVSGKIKSLFRKAVDDAYNRLIKPKICRRTR